MWDGHPNIARPGERFDDTLSFKDGNRAYLESVRPERFVFREYAPASPPLQLSNNAKHIAYSVRGAVVFNPTTKERASPNKNWGMKRWQQLILSAPELRWLQIGEAGSPRLIGAGFMITRHFHEALGVIAGARALIVHEGALHHAAGSFKTPTIVIRGGFISPRVTGYAGQIDMYVDDSRHPLGCGHRQSCAHCVSAMEQIKPEAVLTQLRQLLKQQQTRG